MNSFTSWISENLFPLFLIGLLVAIIAIMLTAIIYDKINREARSEWCYEQGYFEVAATPSGKFICVDFRKEKDPTLAVPESVWKGE